MKPDELPLATCDIHRLALTLAAPCHCGRQGCTIGLHLWWSTRDMTPGIRAQAYEPRTLTGSVPADDRDPAPDPTALAHTRYNALVTKVQQSALELLRHIEGHRPDRWVPAPTIILSDDAWCTNHLTGFGTCEPRYTSTRFQSEHCRWCYDVNRLHGFLPDRPLMRAKHEGRRITETMLIDAKKRSGRNHQKRKKAG